MKTKQIVIEIISYAFILLFAYTALSKLFMYPISLHDLERSPVISPLALPLSILLPALELTICGLLMFDKTRMMGLYASLILMVVFTLYVAFIITIVKKTPCSCGGLIRDLTWRQHLVFNIVFTMLAGIAVWLKRRMPKKDVPETDGLLFS